MKNKVFVVGVLIAFTILTSANVGTALNVFQKELAATGVLTFTDEVEVTNISLEGTDTLKVTVKPKTSAVDGKNYSATLYLDGVQRASSGFVFNSTEITNSTSKVIEFPSLSDLVNATTLKVELN